MKLINYFFIGALLALCACGGAPDPSLVAGRYQFKLDSGEVFVSTNMMDSNVINHYTEMYNCLPKTSIPLNRLVNGKTYRIFIGLPLSGTPESIREEFCNTAGASIYINEQKDFAVFGSKQKNFFSCKACNQAGGSLLLFFCESADSSTALGFLNSNICNRLNESK